MKEKVRYLLAFILTILFLLSGCGGIIGETTQTTEQPNTTQQTTIICAETATVTRVVDGDTFVIDSGEKVRLICIDTPERGNPYYKKATEYLESLVLNKEVCLEKDVSDRDRYGRLLRYVWYNNGLINLKMVESGLADSYRYPPDVKYCDTIEQAEGGE